jgi:hypothetical protein
MAIHRQQNEAEQPPEELQMAPAQPPARPLALLPMAVGAPVAQRRPDDDDNNGDDHNDDNRNNDDYDDFKCDDLLIVSTHACTIPRAVPQSCST